MIVGIVKETAQGERRVAIAPETVGRLERFGVEVVVERGAGVAAALLDEAYVEAGAKVLDAADVDREAELIVRVQKPTPVEIERLRSQQGLIGFLQPLIDPGPTRAIAERGVTAFSMDAIPRISRAQSMDALSSQATVSGYKVSAAGGRSFDQVLSDADHCGWNDPPGQGADHRGRRGRAAGDRDRSSTLAPWCRVSTPAPS